MKLTRRQTLPLIALVGSGFMLNACSSEGDAPEAGSEATGIMAPGPLGEHILGDPAAKVTIIEYASMTCPHCRSFHKEVLPVLKEKYLDTGKAKLYFREFPFDKPAAAAFMLAQCSGEEKYFSMIDVLFEQQSVWARQNVLEELGKIAKLAGFTQESFESCLKNQELLDNVVAIQKKAAEEYGVEATPTFFINGSKYEGNMSADEMSKTIDALL